MVGAQYLVPLPPFSPDLPLQKGGMRFCSGTVQQITSAGIFVDVVSPRGGSCARGFVASALMNGRDVNFQLGEQVHVRILRTSTTGSLSLSMQGGADDILADVQAQLEAVTASKQEA